MSGLTFDAGALVGFERAQRRAVSLVSARPRKGRARRRPRWRRRPGMARRT